MAPIWACWVPCTALVTRPKSRALALLQGLSIPGRSACAGRVQNPVIPTEFIFGEFL